MSTTANVFDARLAYRPEVVALFRATAGPEIDRVEKEVAQLREQASRILAKAGDGDKYIAELLQALKDVEASADLPGMGLPPTPPTCRTCGLLIVQRDNSQWTHAGRELLDKGHLCDPKDKQSPEACPAGTPEQAMQSWEGAHDQERASGGHS